MPYFKACMIYIQTTKDPNLSQWTGERSEERRQSIDTNQWTASDLEAVH